MKKLADVYFSPHDSYFYTDLNTEKQIKECFTHLSQLSTNDNHRNSRNYRKM